jgi:hypothetical protein
MRILEEIALSGRTVRPEGATEESLCHV